MLTQPDDNSGVLIRFPNPEGEGYDNTAWVGVNLGLEIQIDDVARPDGAGIHRTGAIYTFKAPDIALASRGVGDWNRFAITANEQTYDVVMNGTPTSAGSPSEVIRPSRGVRCRQRPPSRGSWVCRRTPGGCSSAGSSGRRCSDRGRL